MKNYFYICRVKYKLAYLLNQKDKPPKTKSILLLTKTLQS